MRNCIFKFCCAIICYYRGSLHSDVCMCIKEEMLDNKHGKEMNMYSSL